MERKNHEKWYKFIINLFVAESKMQNDRCVIVNGNNKKKIDLEKLELVLNKIAAAQSNGFSYFHLKNW